MQYQSPGAEKCKGAIVTQDPPHYVRTPWHVNASGAYRRPAVGFYGVLQESRTGHMPKRSGTRRKLPRGQDGQCICRKGQSHVTMLWHTMGVWRPSSGQAL